MTEYPRSTTEWETYFISKDKKQLDKIIKSFNFLSSVTELKKMFADYSIDKVFEVAKKINDRR